MGERKALSKRTRFEIFKRDGFRCAYCGRTPPTVILHADHIVAVANGGENDRDNLITSCLECNLGKGAQPLTVVAPTLKARLAEQKERADQIASYNKILMALRSGEEGVVIELGTAWYNAIFPQEEQNKWVFGPSRIPSIKRFLRQLTPAEILEAMDATDLAAHRIPEIKPRGGPGRPGDERRFRYFCGVCWKMIQQRQLLGDC